MKLLCRLLPAFMYASVLTGALAGMLASAPVSTLAYIKAGNRRQSLSLIHI